MFCHFISSPVALSPNPSELEFSELALLRDTTHQLTSPEYVHIPRAPSPDPEPLFSTTTSLRTLANLHQPPRCIFDNILTSFAGSSCIILACTSW